jgi:hypothetical protein
MTVAVVLALLVASPVGPLEIAPNHCVHGLHQQPEGPFGVFVFCDDAAGTSIGLVYASPGAPWSGRWSLSDRFWQEASWARDVTSIAWLPGSRLLVATSPVYGTGSLYLLTINDRTALRLYPSTSPSTEIVKIASVSADGRVEITTQTTVGEAMTKKSTVAVPAAKP